MNECIHGNLHTYQIKYNTDSQVHKTNNARRATNELMNQGVNTDSIQCYNTHQESILLDPVTKIISTTIIRNLSRQLKPNQRS